MEAEEKLDQVVAVVSAARTLPMSSSVVINKAELTRLLTELRDLLPGELREAHAVLAQRDGLLREATANAERLLEAAAEERRRLISDEEVLYQAQAEAAAVLQASHDESEQMRRDVDNYVDAKLAHLELSVGNILDTVKQGRQRLVQAGVYPDLTVGDEQPREPEPT